MPVLAVELPINGAVRQFSVEIRRVRRLYTGTGIYEGRLVPRHDGGFFIRSESLLNERETKYHTFLSKLIDRNEDLLVGNEGLDVSDEDAGLPTYQERTADTDIF